MANCAEESTFIDTGLVGYGTTCASLMWLFNTVHHLQNIRTLAVHVSQLFVHRVVHQCTLENHPLLCVLTLHLTLVRKSKPQANWQAYASSAN